MESAYICISFFCSNLEQNLWNSGNGFELTMYLLLIVAKSMMKLASISKSIVHSKKKTKINLSLFKVPTLIQMSIP